MIRIPRKAVSFNLINNNTQKLNTDSSQTIYCLLINTQFSVAKK